MFCKVVTWIFNGLGLRLTTDTLLSFCLPGYLVSKSQHKFLFLFSSCSTNTLGLYKVLTSTARVLEQDQELKIERHDVTVATQR